MLRFNAMILISILVQFLVLFLLHSILSLHLLRENDTLNLWTDILFSNVAASDMNGRIVEFMDVLSAP